MILKWNCSVKILKIIPLLFACSCSVNFNYETKHGIQVSLGESNNPNKQLVEDWTDELIIFWKDLNVEDAIIGSSVDFIDKHPIKVGNLLAWGVSYPWSKYAIIGSGSSHIDFSVVKKIFQHEISHIIIYFCLRIDDEAEGHSYFRKMKANF